MKKLDWKAQVGVGIIMVVAGAGAAQAQMLAAPVGIKTFSDFQRQYGSTKPVVVFQKYQEYKKELKTAEQARTPIASVTDKTKTKTPGDFHRIYSGTKPIVAIQKYQEYRKLGTGAVEARPAKITIGAGTASNNARTFAEFLRANGSTKPSVAAWQYLQSRGR